MGEGADSRCLLTGKLFKKTVQFVVEGTAKMSKNQASYMSEIQRPSPSKVFGALPMFRDKILGVEGIFDSLKEAGTKVARLE